MLRTARPFETYHCFRSSLTKLSHHLAKRTMATVREDSIPHVVRTAHEQRIAGTFNAVISQVDQVNSTIRLIRLGLVGEVVRPCTSRRLPAP